MGIFQHLVIFCQAGNRTYCTVGYYFVELVRNGVDKVNFKIASLGEGDLMKGVIWGIKECTSIQNVVRCGQFQSMWYKEPLFAPFLQHTGDIWGAKEDILIGVSCNILWVSSHNEVHFVAL